MGSHAAWQVIGACHLSTGLSVYSTTLLAVWEVATGTKREQKDLVAWCVYCVELCSSSCFVTASYQLAVLAVHYIVVIVMQVVLRMASQAGTAVAMVLGACMGCGELLSTACWSAGGVEQVSLSSKLCSAVGLTIYHADSISLHVLRCVWYAWTAQSAIFCCILPE